MPDDRSAGGGDDLPDWWRSNVDHFDTYGLIPYQPPRFADDVIAPPVVDELERRYGIDIRIRSFSPAVGEAWDVWLDSEPAFSIERYRDGNGYTVYDIDSDEFEARIATNV